MKELKLEENIIRILQPGEVKISLLKKSDVLDKLNELEKLLNKAEVKMSHSELELIQEQEELKALLIEIQEREREQLLKENEILKLKLKNEELKKKLEAEKQKEIELQQSIQSNYILENSAYIDSPMQLNNIYEDDEDIEVTSYSSKTNSPYIETSSVIPMMAMLTVVVIMLAIVFPLMMSTFEGLVVEMSNNIEGMSTISTDSQLESKEK